MDILPTGLRAATPTDLREASEHATRSIASYFDAFSPAPSWGELPWWPPDVFALANLVLDHTEAYRFVVAPPPGRRWPPAPDWNEQVRQAAQEWRDICAEGAGELPALVRHHWDVVTRERDVPLAEVRSGGAWGLCEALLTLHAVADEACAGLAAAGPPSTDRCFETRARAMLEGQGSLSHLSPTRVRIVPKTHFAARGITIRSLSRYLALCYESVEVRWRRVESETPALDVSTGQPAYNVLLVPWPLSVRGDDFRPVPTPLGNMDTDVFGFFEFAPRAALDVSRVRSLLDAARDEVGRVDAVVLPEAAAEPHEVTELEGALTDAGATFLIAGVRERPTASVFGRNYLHFGVHTSGGWQRYQQDKHHRWCLDESQIRQYHLTRALAPGKQWWEAIDIRERTLHVIDVGGGTTAVPLVCEDLARMDEVADLVRRIGPTVVIAVLLDGPQLTSRWPCRYAGVLGDEPGSAVLTLTALGMAARSRPPGMPPSRVVALWNDGTEGLREIKLERAADGIVISVSIGSKTVWTADGRRHGNVPSLVLARTRQLHTRRVSGSHR
jgi:hypothetical protein